MKEPDPEDFVEKQTSADFSQIIIHMYRAEVQRSYNWRRRLDRTTEWSIVILSALTTWTFSVPERRHELLLGVLIFMGTLLWIESRRFRYYNVWLSRIKTLEENYIARTLHPDEEVSTRDWMKTLAEDLRDPRFKIPFWIAISHRLRRVYLWLISLTVLLWIAKLAIHPTPATDLGMVGERASIMTIPGYVTFSLVGILLAIAILLSILGPRFERKGVKLVEEDKVREGWDEMT